MDGQQNKKYNMVVVPKFLENLGTCWL